MVIFHRIAGLEDLGALQPRHRADHRQLHVLGQRGRDAVRIDGRIVQPLGLEEDLVAVAIGEAMDLVLDRRAVTRPDAADFPGEKRRAVEIGADDLVGARHWCG